jgi:hypothetical protein
MGLWTVAVIVFALNVPFGFWRARTRRFSRQWFLAVHLPIPAVIGFRIFAGLGWHFITFPVLIGAFFFGQVTGSLLQWAVHWL